MKYLKLFVLLVSVYYSHLLLANPIIQLSESEIQELREKDKTLHIISSVNNEPFSLKSKTASIDDDVKLSVVFWKSNGTRIIPYSLVDNLNQFGTHQSSISYGSKTDSLLVNIGTAK